MVSIAVAQWAAGSRLCLNVGQHGKLLGLEFIESSGHGVCEPKGCKRTGKPPADILPEKTFCAAASLLQAGCDLSHVNDANGKGSWGLCTAVPSSLTLTSR